MIHGMLGGKRHLLNLGLTTKSPAGNAIHCRFAEKCKLYRYYSNYITILTKDWDGGLGYLLLPGGAHLKSPW